MDDRSTSVPAVVFQTTIRSVRPVSGASVPTSVLPISKIAVVFAGAEAVTVTASPSWMPVSSARLP